MKTTITNLILVIAFAITSYAQCSDPYAGQDTATCGYTYILSVENVTTGYWTAYIGEEEMNPAPDFAPSNTSADVTVTVPPFDDYTQIVTFVWTDNSGPCADTVLVEFIKTPTVDAGEDQEVCGYCFISEASGTGMSFTWLPEGSTFDDYTDPTTTICHSSYGALDYVCFETNYSSISNHFCEALDTVLIVFYPNPTAEIITDYSDTIFNCGLVIEGLEAENPGTSITGVWESNTEFFPTNGTNINDYVADLMVSESGYADFYWYEQSGPDELNCRDTAGPVTVYFANEPGVIAGNDDSIYGLEYVLSGNVNNIGNIQFPATNNWENGDVIFSDINNDTTLVTVPGFGNYEFILSAYYVGHPECSDSDTVSIVFENPALQPQSIIANIDFDWPGCYSSNEDVTVMLFQQNATKDEIPGCVMVSRQSPGDNGQVVFDGLEDAVYYLSSILYENNAQLLENIYSGNVLTVDEADQVELSGGGTQLIGLNHVLAADIEGTNSINGQAGYENDGNIDGVADEIVVLFDTDDSNVIDVSVTDENGYYYFSDVPDYSNLEVFVSSFEHPLHTSYAGLTASMTDYAVNFIIDGQYVYPEGENSIDQNYNKPIFSFPNIVSDFINIEPVQSINRIDIYDLNGRLVLTAESVINVDVSGLKQGVYLMVLSTGEKSEVHKFVKQ